MGITVAAPGICGGQVEISIHRRREDELWIGLESFREERKLPDNGGVIHSNHLDMGITMKIKFLRNVNIYNVFHI
jgi:hypothetical protein